jgi:hypothetical protein
MIGVQHDRKEDVNRWRCPFVRNTLSINAGAPCRSALADQQLSLFSRERVQAMLGESGVQRAREIVGRINQSAVEIEKKRLRR